MPSNKPKTDLAADLNKLVNRRVNKNKNTLPPRAPRLPIDAQKGAGREGVTPGGSAGEPLSGTLTSADGMFVIDYDYHYHP